MGKGDKKTAKGKRSMGSYGNTRKRKADKPVIVAKPKKEKVTQVKETAKKPAAKKPAAKKSEATKKKEK